MQCKHGHGHGMEWKHGHEELGDNTISEVEGALFPSRGISGVSGISGISGVEGCTLSTFDRRAVRGVVSRLRRIGFLC